MIEIKRIFRPERGFGFVEMLDGYIFTPEANAHKFIITQMVKANGEETEQAFAAGSTVSCRFLKSDKVTELLEGTLEDGAACVTLKPECYSVPGRFLITILVTSGSSVICVYAASGTVIGADSENVNISEGASREIDEKIAEINAAAATAQAAVSQVQAAVAGVPAVIASIPQDYTALSNSVGDLKSAVVKVPTITLANGRISNTGELVTDTAGYYKRSQAINLDMVKTIRIANYYTGASLSTVTILDKNGDVLDYLLNPASGQPYVEITVPSGGVNGYVMGTSSLTPVVTLFSSFDVIKSTIKESSVAENITIELTNGRITNEGKVVGDTGDYYKVSQEIDVSIAQKIRIRNYYSSGSLSTATVLDEAGTVKTFLLNPDVGLDYVEINVPDGSVSAYVMGTSSLTPQVECISSYNKLEKLLDQYLVAENESL